MPNTIAHLGFHALGTRALLPKSDFKWILMGAVLPDMPFVAKRAIMFFQFDIDILDVRLFSVVQASLIFSLLLAIAGSQFSRRPFRVFVILTLGVAFHLLLDACQIKWGNGPRLLVPFDWSIFSLHLFWPEDLPSHLLTAFGALTLVFIFTRPIATQAADLVWPNVRRLIIVFSLLVVYLLGPILFLDAAEQSGASGVRAIRMADRTGIEIDLDRARFRRLDGALQIELYSGHFIPLHGIEDPLSEQGKISVQGEFVSHEVIHAHDHHLNFGRYRELASMIGLSLILVYWLIIISHCLNSKFSIGSVSGRN